MIIMGSGIIEITGLTKKYGDRPAVDSLDLTVEKGEIFGFLGPNGAGKTTTIKSMLGLLNFDKGEVRINGNMLAEDRNKAITGVGYLPEDVRLYDNLTGRETLDFYAELKGAPQDQVSSLLERFDLREAEDKKVGDYSKGMKQKIALAQSVLRNPPLLVLDEPTSGLDPKGTATVKDIVSEYSENGGTVFFSSHILPNVEEVADRVGILREGKLQSVGPIDELRDDLGILNELTLSLSDNIEKIEDFLKESDKVKEYEESGNEVIITCRKKDKREIMNLIEDRGVEIIDFSVEKENLEDIFMKLTEETK